MIKLAFNVMFRPTETFHDLQWQGLGRVRDALLLVGLAYIASLVSLLVTAFPFETVETEASSLFIQAIRVIVPWLIWVVANYAVSSIALGEGRFRDVVIGCAYALAPYIIFSVPIALLTNVLTLGEGSLVEGLYNLVYGWCGVLFFLQLQVQHNFEGFRAILITGVMLFAAAVVAFSSILAYALTDQVVRFVIQVFMELTIRG